MKHLDRIWNQPNLTMPTKIRMYSTCVLAVLLYGSETWTLTQADWKRLDSFHTRCQRRILHTRWYDFVSNNEVLRRTGLLAASSIVCKRRLGLFGHVARLNRGCSSKPDPSDLLRSPRWCPTISWLETRLWSTSHYLDPSDLPGHRNISDRRSAAGRRPLVLATNRNGGMLRLNASCRDDDDGNSMQITEAATFFAVIFGDPTLWNKLPFVAEVYSE